ncbi:intraflagellar transport protein, putative [Ichthyophthirius multifiliis]|uniref:Intraflagellar transport protein, putative n=1 Tax=Ichthyophthirius multifiliis TaxID=5932 RepID=G0QVY6_ICHMU|nr:intraflagellar transport protein, putative [Ichthyophthirius multifiliis]EGR30620.1 intraflagellar transport protein, putative [Ichthyophthirius multifiliis]|eukprot:XP_004032207.1 intraflagellar transport protein, putative [Ichthyophthirius multifiliis]
MRPIQTAQKGLVTGIKVWKNKYIYINNNFIFIQILFKKKGDGGFQGVGVPNLKIIERPVTKDGMTGMSTKPQSQGRVYQDKGYFMNILRQKTSDIIDQIKKFKEKVEQIQQDNQTYNNLQKRFDELIKQVRSLEGQLADYNLAFDKQRSQTRPEEIRNMYEHIKFQNQRQAEQLDEIFIERKNQEEQIMQIEQQLNQITQLAEQKITELDPDQRQEYDNLVKENRQLNQEINMQRQILDELNNKLLKLNLDQEWILKNQKGNIQKNKLLNFQEKKEDFEMQLNEANLSFPEARDRLLNRVKEDNALTTQTDKRIKEIQKNIDNYEKKNKRVELRIIFQH